MGRAILAALMILLLVSGVSVTANGKTDSGGIPLALRAMNKTTGNVHARNGSLIVSGSQVKLPLVVITVNENISVIDMPAVIPPAVIAINENITVTDKPAIIPPAVISINENITVTDAPVIIPPAVITIDENVTVTDVPSVIPPAVISINENIAVTDSPAIPNYYLMMAVSGIGTVNPAAGIYHFLPGIVVDISASPSTDWKFVNWTGDSVADPNSANTTVTMDGNKSVTANFFPNSCQLDIKINPPESGTVYKIPDKDIYYYGDEVQLTASPSEGYHFEKWSGDSEGSQNPLVFTLKGNYSVTANFALTCKLEVTVSPLEGGNVFKNPDKEYYNYGDVVQLTAVPAEGCRFVEWSNYFERPENPLLCTLDGDKYVTANFIKMIPPEVLLLPPLDLTSDSITLRGQLSQMGSASEVKLWFQWTLLADSDYTEAETIDGDPAELSETGYFKSTITNLAQGTDYRCRAKAEGDGITCSIDYIFVTEVLIPSSE
jgi:hypothetical protein